VSYFFLEAVKTVNHFIVADLLMINMTSYKLKYVTFFKSWFAFVELIASERIDKFQNR